MHENCGLTLLVRCKLLEQPAVLDISQHVIVGFVSKSLKFTGVALQEVFHLQR